MNLREWRTSKGWTLLEASKHMGLSTSRLSDLERGRGNPTLRTVDEIAQLTGGAVTRADWPNEMERTSPWDPKPRATRTHRLTEDERLLAEVADRDLRKHNGASK